MKKSILIGLLLAANVSFSQSVKTDTLEIAVNIKAYVLYNPNAKALYRDNKITYAILPLKTTPYNTYSGKFIVNDDGYERFMRVLPYPKPDGEFPLALRKTQIGFRKNYGKDSTLYKYYTDYNLNAKWIRYHINRKAVADDVFRNDYLKTSKLENNEYIFYILKEVISLKENF